MTCLHCDSKCLSQEPQPSSAEVQTTLQQNIFTDSLPHLEFSKEQWRSPITHVHRKKLRKIALVQKTKENVSKIARL